MKARFLLFLLLVGFYQLTAQIPKGVISMEDEAFNDYATKKENTPIVQGRFVNFSPGQLAGVKVKYAISVPLFEEHVKKITEVKSDGTFNLVLDNPFPYQKISIEIDNYYSAILYATKDLMIEFDLKKFGDPVRNYGTGVEYKGTDGPLNEFINKYADYKRGKKNSLHKKIYELKGEKSPSMEEYVLELDNLFSELKLVEDEFVQANPSPHSWILENERMSHYYTKILQPYVADVLQRSLKKNMDETLLRKVKMHKGYVISDEAVSFYKNLVEYLSKMKKPVEFYYYTPVEFAKILELPGLSESQRVSGKELLDTWKKHEHEKKSDTLSKIGLAVMNSFDRERTWIFIEKEFTVLDTMLGVPKADLLKLHYRSPIFYEDKPPMQDYVRENLRRTIQTTWCRNLLVAMNKKGAQQSKIINQWISEARPAAMYPLLKELPFGAKLYEVSERKPNEFLADLKNEFKGKAIIVDFWAIWCGSCIQAMPNSKKLQQETANWPREFVYVCTSDGGDMDKWEKRITELELPGTHIFMDEGIVNELMLRLGQEGFPGYAFVDKNGAFVSDVINDMMFLDSKRLAELISK